MDEKRAKEILGDTIKPEYGLHDLYCYTDWKNSRQNVTLNGLFTAEELEAIAWWMKNKGKKGEDSDG